MVSVCKCCICFIISQYFFTGFLWRFIKEPIVLAIVILLFYPIVIDPSKGQYAPAIAVMAIDFLMHVGDHQLEIANELFYAIEITLVVYFIFAIFIRWPIEFAFRRWWIKRKKQRKDVNQNHQEDDIEQENMILHANEKL